MLDFRNKSQISIFVVIGVVLVLVLGFLYFNSQTDLFIFGDNRLKNQISGVVIECIQDSGERGAFFLGFKGGFINLPQTIENDPRKHVDFGLKIPTWDSELSFTPTIDFMEEQLEDFVEDESYDCIESNLATLEDTLEIDIGDEMRAKVEINDQNIIIETNLPINFKEKNDEDLLNVEDYFVRLDSLRLGDMYDLSLQIYSLESNDQFIEDLVLDQIRSSSDYDSEISIPTEGMLFTCGKRIWTKSQIKENLANLNNNNFKYLYFEGTYPIDDVIEANLGSLNLSDSFMKYYDSHYRFILPEPESSFENYKVELIMPSKEITGNDGIFNEYPFRDFQITPSSGEIVSSINLDYQSEFGFKIPVPCIQIFHHLYTLDYDLILRVTDMSSDGQGYIFQYPIRVQIDRNEPKRVSFVTPLNLEQTTFTEENFCSEESKEYPLRVFVNDGEGNFLEDVNITYNCLSVSCEMGKTGKPTFRGVVRDDSVPFYEGNFPYCLGGDIIAKKDGYHTSKERADTDEKLKNQDPVVSYDIELIPIKEFEIDISSFLILDTVSLLGERVRSENDGLIYGIIENSDYKFESQVIWPNDSDLFNSLKLLDRKDVDYNVTLYYTDSDGDLLGLVQKSWTPDPNLGNSVEFIIPKYDEKVTEENYEDFFEKVLEAQESGDYGVFIR